MIAALLPFFIRFLPYIAGVLFVAAGWTYANHACWSAACHKYRDKAESVQVEFDAYVTKQNQIVADLKAKQADAVSRIEIFAVQLEKERAKSFGLLQDRARRIAADSAARLSAAAVKLSDDAASAAAAAAGPTAKPAEALAAPSNSTEEWIVAAYDWMGQCKARVSAWESFYQSLRGE